MIGKEEPGKIRIVSNGNGWDKDTMVYNVATGEAIPNVYKAEWSCDAGKEATAILYIRNVELEYTNEYGEVKYQKEK